MQITKSNSDGVEIFTIQGQLDGTTSPQLDGELLGAVQSQTPRVILELAQVVLVSSAALRVLLAAAKRMKKHGGLILLCGLQPQVRQVFDISDLTAFFGMYPEIASALAAAKAGGAVPPPAAGQAPRKPPISPAPPPVVNVPPAPPREPVPRAVPPAFQAPVELPRPPETVRNVVPPIPTGEVGPASPPPVPAPPPGLPAVPTPAAAEAEPDPGETMLAPVYQPTVPPKESPPSSGPLAKPEALPVPVPTATSKTVSLVPPGGEVKVSAVSTPPALPPAPRAGSSAATSLRRTAPAVLAKAREAAAEPKPPVTAPLPAVTPVTVPPPVPKVPVASLSPPARTRRPFLPILAVVALVLGVVGVGLFLLRSKKPTPPKNTVSTSAATPSPTQAAVEPTPTHPPIPVVVAAPSPSPVLPVVIATPSPAVALTTPTVPATPTPPAATPINPASENNISTAAGAFDFKRGSPENQAVSQAVLRRIDAMPLAEKDKAKLYQALDNARGLGKLITVNFGSNRADLAPSDIGNLNKALHQPKVQQFLDDPTVVLIVLGFADTRGSGKVNKEVSERRAKKVADALRGPCAVGNVIHPLGMGGQEIAGESLEKNRVVEVWAVMP